MAGMRAVHKKNGTTFKYSGDLKETIEKAEKELKEKEGTTQRDRTDGRKQEERTWQQDSASWTH